jgi:hypothetical protein
MNQIAASGERPLGTGHPFGDGEGDWPVSLSGDSVEKTGLMLKVQFFRGEFGKGATTQPARDAHRKFRSVKSRENANMKAASVELAAFTPLFVPWYPKG